MFWLSFQRHTPFCIYFFRQSLEKCLSYQSSPPFPHCFSSYMKVQGVQELAQDSAQGAIPSTTFFAPSSHIQRTQLHKPLLPLSKQEANMARLRASEDLAAPSSSIFFIPVSPSNSEILGVFKASLIKQCAPPLPRQMPFRDGPEGRRVRKDKLILFLLFSSRKVRDEIISVVAHDKTLWTQMFHTEGKQYFNCVEIQLCFNFPDLFHLQKNTRKAMGVKRQPLQQLNWSWSKASFPASAAALIASLARSPSVSEDAAEAEFAAFCVRTRNDWKLKHFLWQIAGLWQLAVTYSWNAKEIFFNVSQETYKSAGENRRSGSPHAIISYKAPNLSSEGPWWLSLSPAVWATAEMDAKI